MSSELRCDILSEKNENPSMTNGQKLPVCNPSQIPMVVIAGGVPHSNVTRGLPFGVDRPSRSLQLCRMHTNTLNRTTLGEPKPSHLNLSPSLAGIRTSLSIQESTIERRTRMVFPSSSSPIYKTNKDRIAKCVFHV